MLPTDEHTTAPLLITRRLAPEFQPTANKEALVHSVPAPVTRTSLPPAEVGSAKPTTAEKSFTVAPLLITSRLSTPLLPTKTEAFVPPNQPEPAPVTIAVFELPPLLVPTSMLDSVNIVPPLLITNWFADEKLPTIALPFCTTPPSLTINWLPPPALPMKRESALLHKEPGPLTSAVLLLLASARPI